MTESFNAVAGNPSAEQLVIEILATWYQTDPVRVASLCDEELDRSGALLGWVREEAAKETRNART